MFDAWQSAQSGSISLTGDECEQAANEGLLLKAFMFYYYSISLTS